MERSGRACGGMGFDVSSNRVPATPSSELESIAAMLTAASEFGLEAEVVCVVCDILRAHPDVSIPEAAFQALAEWDC